MPDFARANLKFAISPQGSGSSKIKHFDFHDRLPEKIGILREGFTRIIEDWKRFLPVDFSTDNFDFAHLQLFKFELHNFFGSRLSVAWGKPVRTADEGCRTVLRGRSSLSRRAMPNGAPI